MLSTMTRSARNGGNALEGFETHRRSANRHLEAYFECLGQYSRRDGLPGLKGVLRNSQGKGPEESSRVLLLKNLSTIAIQELIVLEDILKEVIEQEQPYAKAISLGLLSWAVSCLSLAYIMPSSALCVAFKIGTFVSAILQTVRLIRKYIQGRKLVPLQHKVRGLIRAFKNGTIRYRDLDEVLITSLA